MSVLKNYEVVPYKPTSCEKWETRYCIIDAETGEVLDDAQGYGYKTVQKAHAGYGYKNKSKSERNAIIKRQREIQKWLKSQKGLLSAMDDISFRIAKGAYGPDDKFDAREVADILQSFGIVCEYKPGEILRAWEKM